MEKVVIRDCILHRGGCLEMLANDEKPRLDFVPPIVKTVKNGGAVYLCTRFDVALLWSNALTEAGLWAFAQK